MKTLILGGGPGGLYAGLLLKKANPAFDIHIIERNPANATYGWGVVFSDRTLNAYREADVKTYEAITDNFVIWQAIDTFYRDRVIRCDGHSFAGLARQKMLNILQARCHELGVKLSYEREISDVALFKNYDFIIAADGVNSLVRNTYTEVFKPTVTVGKAKFVWFGTDKVLDSFTFIFRENKHGLFQAHSYPFDGTTSTFIVECEEAVWKRAGLHRADEAASIAYCEKLFADFLGGRRLLSNKSLWLNFNEVRNVTWRHENIVLLGDSAHTAHFSIGSGTKLAMDGAIALANAFEKSDNLQQALSEYEKERRPRVFALQEAARQSQDYFENIKRYLLLEPMQFTTQLLTRSGRVTYDNLRVRDPYYIDSVDRWFSAPQESASESVAVLVAPPPMFTPFTLRKLTLANRAVVSPTSTYAAKDGRPGDDQHAALLKAAQSGAALLLTEPVAVSTEGRITPGCAGIYDKKQLAAWRSLVGKIHKTTAAKIALTLNHAGRRGATRPRQAGLDRPLPAGGWGVVAASALPYSSGNQTPKKMTRADMDKVRADFVNAARMADEAGFDMLHLHFGHGYLLGGFISPLTNVRKDQYGGSLEKRLRFPLEIFAAVRNAWPDDKPIALAFTASDWAAGGLSPQDAIAIAAKFKAAGCDIIETLAGQTVPDVHPLYGPAFLAPYSDRIRHEADIATIVRGQIMTSGQINGLLAAGQADLCVLTPPPDKMDT